MATTRIARPLERSSSAPEWWRGIIGAALLGISGILFATRAGVESLPEWILPLLVFAAGVVLVWSPLDSAVAGDARRPDVAGLFGRDAWVRVVLGVAGVSWAGWWFATWKFTSNVTTRAIVVPLVLVAAIVLVFAPWWLRLIRQVAVEREQRAREFERAEIAAHLHDSVLQTLTLIRAKAHEPETVARLARAQERDLRAYLYQGRRTADESIATALGDVVSEIEDAHAITVDLVTVGDGPTTTPMRAALQAAREALANAARHAHGPVSAYAELSARSLEIFIRDAGPGFDPERVPAGRLGIANSIIGRVERHGGTATVTSAPGSATEVHIIVPREEP
ncbi:MAG: histidine kinase [Actinomycetes bacterium]